MKNKYPSARALQFLLCEDVRQEEGGKLGIGGLFPAEEIVVQSGAIAPDAKGVAVIESICLVYLFKGGQGTFLARLQIEAPSGGQAIEQTLAAPVELKSKGTGVFVVKLRPFLVTAFGEHRVTLKLDDHEYQKSFFVRDAAPKSANGAKAA